ncbi:STAS domain-containing protein [Colwelliaceae bacterium MEBiC 14330]
MLSSTYTLNNDFIIQLHGAFDADMVKSMKNELETYSKFNTNIIFDLSKVNFIDSSGIGAIVYLYKRMSKNGFCVCVTGLTKQPLELFQMLFLDQTINCYPDIGSYTDSINNLKEVS